SFKKYALGEAYISTINFLFFKDQNELSHGIEDGLLDSVALLDPSQIALFTTERVAEISAVMPRVFGAFFNQNKAPVLAHLEIRKALDMSVDKAALVQSILQGYGKALKGPTASDLWQNSLSASSTDRVSGAREYLENNGWKLNVDGILEK